MDLFDKVTSATEPFRDLAARYHGVLSFPRLEGTIGAHMHYQGRRCLVWSLNNYLGLAADPAVMTVDSAVAEVHGMSAPMGARMMSGDTMEHELLERELAEYSQKDDAVFVNYGYQGMVSAIDALTTRHDWILYDAECHACIIDGVRLHQGRSFAFRHNDAAHLEELLERAESTMSRRGAILVITEGVFGMSGEQGRLRDVLALKERHEFRVLVDDAHGFGVMGPNGGGTGEAQGVQDEIDLYFGTFAKAGASIGAFYAGPGPVISHLRYTMRSQIFSKGLPMPIVMGNRKRLRLMLTQPERRERMWEIAEALRSGLRDEGFDLGNSDTAITPVFLQADIPAAARFLTTLRDEFSVFCSPVIYPVVPPGVLMLRLIPTCEHTLEDVEHTIVAFRQAREAAEHPEAAEAVA